MRLEGVQPIGREDHDGAARLGDTHHLGRRGAIVIDVLDDLVGEDHVEVIVGVGQCLTHREHDVGQALAGLGDAIRFDLDTVNVVAVVAEAAHVRADATADVEDAGILQRDVAPHHLEASILTDSATSSWAGRARSTS